MLPAIRPFAKTCEKSDMLLSVMNADDVESIRSSPSAYSSPRARARKALRLLLAEGDLLDEGALSAFDLPHGEDLRRRQTVLVEAEGAEDRRNVLLSAESSQHRGARGHLAVALLDRLFNGPNHDLAGSVTTRRIGSQIAVEPLGVFLDECASLGHLLRVGRRLRVVRVIRRVACDLQERVIGRAIAA